MPQTRVKPLSNLSTPSSMEEDSYNPNDYLRDPELWRDELPQPFRMIDDVLQELLSIAWNNILETERQKREEASRPRTSQLVPYVELEIPGVRCYVTAGSVLVIGVSEGLATVDLAETHPQPKLLPTTDSTPVLSLTSQAVCLQDAQYWLVAAVSKTGCNHFLIHMSHTIQLRDIEFSGGRQPLSCCLSLGASHLVVSFKEEAGSSVEVYQLPISHWLTDVHSSLTKHRDALAAEQEGRSEGSDGPATRDAPPPPPPLYQPPEPTSFTKPTFVRKLSPPLPLQPCSESEPAFALANLRSATKQCLSTGEKHVLTSNFFNNRLKVFMSLRAGFLLEPVTLMGHGARGPAHFHFLHYKDGLYSADPLSLLLWWEGGTQLLQYSLAVNPKAKADSAPPLERVWPQSSAITCSSINKESSVLALGLENGVVVVCDVKKDIFHHVFWHPCGSPICCVSFYPSSSHSAPLLLVGDAAGKIYQMDAGKSMEDDRRVTNYTTEVLQCSESERGSPVTDVVAMQHTDVVLALHEDGCLRRLSPSMSEFKPSGVVKKAELCCVSGGSHVVAVCSHRNLQTDGENEESAQDNIMVYVFDVSLA